MDRGGGIVNVCGERGKLRLLRHLHHCKVGDRPRESTVQSGSFRKVGNPNLLQGLTMGQHATRLSKVGGCVRVLSEVVVCIAACGAGCGPSARHKMR